MFSVKNLLINKERVSPTIKVTAFFAAVTLVFFAPVLFTNSFYLPNGTDFVNFNYPNDLFAARSLQAGDFPLWNPYVAAGQPYAADPNIGFFYPFRLLLTATHFNYKMMVYLLIFHYFLAGIFTYALARELGASRPGSLVAGVGFMFSGFLIGQMDHINIVMSSIWLPLIFLLFRRAILRGEKKYALLAGLTLSFSILGGHQQFSLFAGYWCGFWLFVHLIQNRGRGFVRMFGLCGLMLFVALGAAAIQIVPTLEFFTFTQRNTLDIAQASAYSMPPNAWLLLLLPHFFGLTGGQGKLFWNTFPNEFYVYGGVIILFGALLGSYTWKSREKPFLLSMIVLSFLLTAGDVTPVYRLLYYLLPGMKFVRVPGRFVFWVDLSLALVAAFGVDWILYRMAAADKRLSRDAIFLSALGMVAGIAFWLIYPTLRPFPYPNEIMQYRLADSLIFAGLFLGLTSLLFLQRIRPGHSPWRPIFLIGLVMIDLFVAQWPRHFTQRDVLQTFDHPQIIQYLKNSSELPRMSFTNGAYGTEKWAPLTGLIFGFYQYRGLPWNPFNLQNFDNYSEIASGGGPFYNFLGIKYLVADQDETLPEPWQEQFTSDHLTIYENSQAAPRAFMVYQSLIEPDPQKTLALMEENKYDPLTAVLLTSGESFSGPAGTSEISITNLTNNTMTVDVESNQPGYLVVSDIFYPGWRVTVNGARQEIQQANYAFRAVFVPNGRSTVRFEFIPSSIIGGAVITLLTWSFILFVSILYLKKRLQDFYANN